MQAEAPGHAPAKVLRVLSVQNHAQLVRHLPFAGVFVERQMASLGDRGVEVTRVDIGTSYAPWALLRKLHELLLMTGFYRKSVVVVKGYFISPETPPAHPTVLDLMGR